MTPIYKMVDGVEIALTEEEIAEWVALQEEAPLAQWAEIRAERNAKLAACDWTQLPDAPADTAAWTTYRQELRDITTQNDPFDIIWPVSPSAGE